MSRPRMYNEPVVKTSLSLRASVKRGLEQEAPPTGLSVSQLINVLAEDWLRRRGYPLEDHTVREPAHEPVEAEAEVA